MRRLWIVLLGVVTAGLRSWARLWGRVASAAERRLTAGVQAMGPPAAAGSQDAPASGPPAHWLAHIQARAPGVTFRRVRAPGRAPSQAAAAPVSQSAGLPPPDHKP